MVKRRRSKQAQAILSTWEARVINLGVQLAANVAAHAYSAGEEEVQHKRP